MKIPNRCPSCGSGLTVQALHCSACSTRVEGEYDLCPVCSLADEDRALLDLYLKVRGNAKGVERELGISYPTVRARLEQLWQRLDALRARSAAPPPEAPVSRPEPPAEGPERSSADILRELQEGVSDVSRTAALLRTRGRVSPHRPATGKG